MRFAYKIMLLILAALAGSFSSVILFSHGVDMEMPPKELPSVKVTAIQSPDMPLAVRILRVDRVKGIAELEVENKRGHAAICFAFKSASVLQESGERSIGFDTFGPVTAIYFSDLQPEPESYIPPGSSRRVEIDFSLPDEEALKELLESYDPESRRLKQGLPEPYDQERSAMAVEISLDLAVFDDGMVWGEDEGNKLRRLELCFQTLPVRARELLKRIESTGLQEQVRWAETLIKHWEVGQQRIAIEEALSSEDPARRQAAMDQEADYYLAKRVVGAMRTDPETCLPKLRNASEYKLVLWRP